MPGDESLRTGCPSQNFDVESNSGSPEDTGLLWTTPPSPSLPTSRFGRGRGHGRKGGERGRVGCRFYGLKQHGFNPFLVNME